MAPDSATKNALVQALADEASRLAEDALYCHAGHNEETCSLRQLATSIRYPGHAFRSCVTSFSTAPAAGYVSFWPSVAAGILSFGVAAMIGLMNTFLDPKSRAAEHY
jgi:hypothetical protein